MKYRFNHFEFYLFTILICIAAQTFVFLLIHIGIVIGSVNIHQIVNSKYIIPIILSIMIICIVSIVKIHVGFIKSRNTELTEIKLAESEKSNLALRAQKHDFNNHLQVIQGLIQLDRPDKVMEYIQKLSNKQECIVNLGQLNISEILSILFKKIILADGKSIHTEIEFNSSIKNINIDTSYISSILNNLLNNAIEALDNIKTSEKDIKVTMNEDSDFYIINVWNNLPVISQENMEHIFESGFSTKAKENRGYGLYIIKTIIDNNNGKIIVKSNKNYGTSFTVKLPKISKSIINQ